MRGEVSEDVLSLVRGAVSTGLHDVDLTGPGPLAVGVVDGKHPQGGPEPVAKRQFGDNLDLAVLDGMAILRCDTGAHDRVDDRASG